MLIVFITLSFKFIFMNLNYRALITKLIDSVVRKK